LTEVVSQEFTVGKVDAGMAILLSPDHHLIEFPATILPVCKDSELSGDMPVWLFGSVANDCVFATSFIWIDQNNT
jgi:hypothetical protein